MIEKKEVLNTDILILGGGPGGLSAALYAARGNAETAIVDLNMIGGQPCNYLEIENYPGYSTIGGFELMEKFEEHVDKFGVSKYPMQEITSINLKGEKKTIETTEKIFEAKAVILACGACPKKLNVEGETEFVGRGVSYCAVCDAAFYRDKTVVVVGGGNSAIEEAIYLTKFAKKVIIVHRRDGFRADRIVIERATSNDKIEFMLNYVVERITGNDSVENIVLRNVITNEIVTVEADGIFPYIGIEPNVQLFNNQLKQDKYGFIETDETMKTSEEGVWAIGDIRVTPLRQVVTAASDGAIAAVYAAKYLEAKTYERVKV